MSQTSPYERYETVIGLEVHCQLATQSKIFSSASTAFGASPNTQVMHVDLGLPGALPVLNRHAVELAITAGLALSCKVNPWSQFARKNYFYPDLPKGYQISQHTFPLCSEGQLAIPLDPLETREEGAEPPTQKVVRIERIHMEEDAGKSSHLAGEPYSVVDLNRAGTPLIEIVSRPDMRSADEAVAYLKELHLLVVSLGLCDGNMEEGSFRCDANVSVRPIGSETLGTRCELKNINSFKFIRDAITFEVRRQIDLIESGQRVIQQTRLYDADRGQTFAMRDKEEAHDYRYFPEPDLPPLSLDPGYIEHLRAALPELPWARRARYQHQLGLSPYDASVLVASPALASYFDAALAHSSRDPKGLSNWICNELLGSMPKGATLDSPPVAPAHMAELVDLILDDVISGKIAKQVLAELLTEDRAPSLIVEEKGLRQISDPDQLGAIIDEIIAKNPKQVEQFRSGKDSLLGFFVGQVMKATRGMANPNLVNELLASKLA